MTESSPDHDRLPPISVILPTKDRPELLDRCLTTLKGALGPADELIVVDSASADPAVREVAIRNGVRYLRSDQPGCSTARNVGWRACAHDLVAFVDDDILVGTGWAEIIKEAFAREPDLAFMTGRVQVPSEQGPVDMPASVDDHPFPEELTLDVARPRGISGNLAVRREALLRIEGFDEMVGTGQHFPAGSDLDFFDRILAAGFRGRYEPKMLVGHYQWRTTRQRLRLDWNYGVGGGARLAKLLRTDPHHARAVARDILWRWGVLSFFRALRAGYERAALAAVIRVAGMLRGLAEGLMIPVRNGHYRRATGKRASR